MMVSRPGRSGTDRRRRPAARRRRGGLGHTVLDVATGPGYLAARAAARGAVVVGVGLAPEMLARARALNPGIDFRVSDALRLGFGDSSFAAVVAGFLAALLHGAGLEDVSVTTHASTHRVASADELWDGVVGGTARTAALVNGQPEHMRHRIRAAFDRHASRYETADGLQLRRPRRCRRCKVA